MANKRLRLGTEDIMHVSGLGTIADPMSMFSGFSFGGLWVMLILNRSGGFPRCDPDR